LFFSSSRSILVALAALPQFHLIGSTTHQNAALLWGAQQVRQLNPLWVEASTGLYHALTLTGAAGGAPATPGQPVPLDYPPGVLALVSRTDIQG